MFRRTLNIFAFFILFWSSLSFGKVDFWVWQASPHSARFLLPRVDDESAQASYERYVNGVDADPRLKEIFPKPILANGGRFRAGLNTEELTAFLIANEASDMSEHHERMNEFLVPLKDAGADTYVIPVAADIGLSETDAEDFRQKIARQGDLIIGMGGDDIDPRLSGQDNESLLSKDVNPSIVHPEARLWRTILTVGKSYSVGICRSHQLILSLLGYKLVLDIETQLKLPSHRKGYHPLVRKAMSVFDNVFNLFLYGESNTLHHQGFFGVENSDQYEVTNVDEHGVLESGVFKNGRGATFQFHPERMSPEAIAQFFKTIVQEARASRNRPATPMKLREFEKSIRSCEAAFI